MRVALVGNPNVGKTTLFNALTGLSLRVGNWSGVTVAAHSATFTLGSQSIELVDLPGLYSLAIDDKHTSPDEQIAIDFMADTPIDCIINVVSACHLERHAYLTHQLLERGLPVIIVLTMTDEALQQGLVTDTAQLAARMGCPVVVGAAALQQQLKLPLVAVTRKPLPQEDSEVTQAAARYQAVAHLLTGVQVSTGMRAVNWTEKLDTLVLQRFLAIPLFFGVMYVLFFFAMQGGGWVQQYLSQVTDAVFVTIPHVVLRTMHAPPWLIAWLANGIGRGVSTTLTFIPVMACMFFFLSLLETSGYMARAAFIMDRAMRYLGLPGKSFVPMIIGFGCNVPAVLAARTLESTRERLLTILMMPFMSCSARLTIYAVFVAAFFPHGGHNVVFSLYLVGILMGVFTGYLLRRSLFAGPISPLVLELPRYQWPAWRRMLTDTWRRLYEFIWRAGCLIVPVSALLGALNSYSITGHLVDGSAESLLAWIGQHVVWLFAPLGIAADNWPAAVGLMTGTLAKEVVVGTLSTLYAGGSMQQQFDGQIGAYAYLLFVLLYIPCVSTMAVIRQEAGRELMWFAVIWSSVLAYVTAAGFYQLATFARHPTSSVLWLLLFASLLYVFLAVLTKRVGYFSTTSALLQGVAPGCERRCSGCNGRGPGMA